LEVVFHTQAASSDNTPEDEDFVDCSRNNNSTETKQTDLLDNEETEDKTTKHNNNLNVSLNKVIHIS
jgi:hypothetical protein